MRPGLRLLAFLLCATTGGAALAHPTILFLNQTIIAPTTLRLVSNSPGENQAVKGQPQSLNLLFSQNLNPQRSSLTLSNPFSRTVPLTNLTVKDGELSATLPPLDAGSNGTYKVEWNAECACANPQPQSGFFFFKIER